MRTGLAVLTLPVLLTGCSSAPAATSSAASSAAVSTVGPSLGPAAPVPSVSPADQATQYASNTPPEAAKMLCTEDVRGEVVAAALGVASVPAPESSWADHVYTCTYALPMGRLVLAVTVTPGSDPARAALQAMRGQLGATQEEPGLGEQAYSAPGGTVIAVKDNMVLRVDATGMPDGLGAAHEGRLDFARVVAAGVFTCWTGA